MSVNPETQRRRFQVDDRVKVVFRGIFYDREGVVAQVIEHKGDHVYRYRVRFEDEKTALFFEFELTPN
jgi:hypothetical protein